MSLICSARLGDGTHVVVDCRCPIADIGLGLQVWPTPIDRQLRFRCERPRGSLAGDCCVADFQPGWFEIARIPAGLAALQEVLSVVPEEDVPKIGYWPLD